MKKLKYLLIVFLFIPFFKLYAAGSISVSTSSISIEEGSSKTFTVKANNAAGRVDISSSNASVTVSKSKIFLDNNTETITVKGKKVGTATIRVNLADVATYDDEQLNGVKTIHVYVNEKKTTTTKPEAKTMSISSFEIVGYPIDFDYQKTEYSIDVFENVTELYINISGKNFTATGDKKVNIKDKNEIVVNLKDDKNSIDYRIIINRVKKEEKVENTNCSNTIYKENDLNKIIVGVALFFILLSIVLIYITLKGGKNKPAKEKKEEIKKDVGVITLSEKNLVEEKTAPSVPKPTTKPVIENSNWYDSPFNENKISKPTFIDKKFTEEDDDRKPNIINIGNEGVIENNDNNDDGVIDDSGNLEKIQHINY